MTKRQNKKIIRNLGYRIVDEMSQGLCDVYLVKENNSNKEVFRTLKIATDSRTSGYRHILTENKVLDGLKKVNGVAKKIDYKHILISRNNALVLVKEFIEGETLFDKYCKFDKQQQKSLEQTVNSIHRVGFAQLDLKSQNIVIADNKKPYLIDLGTAVSRKSMSPVAFANYEKKDIERLENIFKDMYF
ncbi:MAG: hypothetical protein ABIB43_00405 [archaeon]